MYAKKSTHKFVRTQDLPINEILVSIFVLTSFHEESITTSLEDAAINITAFLITRQGTLAEVLPQVRQLILIQAKFKQEYP